jgi:hypothetical protein
VTIFELLNLSEFLRTSFSTSVLGILYGYKKEANQFGIERLQGCFFSKDFSYCDNKVACKLPTEGTSDRRKRGCMLLSASTAVC